MGRHAVPLVTARPVSESENARAMDVRRRYRIPDLDQFRPHLGLLFAMEDCDSANQPHPFYGDSRYSRIGDGLSPKARLSEIFRRFREDRLYDEICYTISTEDLDSAVEEPDSEMRIGTFVDGVVRAVELRAQSQGQSGLTAQTLGELLARRSDVDAVLSGVTSTPQGRAPPSATPLRLAFSGVVKPLRRPSRSEGCMPGLFWGACRR